MPKHLVKVIPRAEKEIERLDYQVQDRIFEKIESLSFNPLPNNVIRMKNSSLYRIKVGDYRIIYQIDHETLYILKVGHRKDVYK